MKEKIKIALVQHTVTDDWDKNMADVIGGLETAKKNGAQIAALSEMFICPYELEQFVRFAEPVPEGRTCELLERTARRLEMVIIGGSIPESDNEGKIYNTATVWSEKGDLLARHRKIHLFDVDLPGSVSFKESEVLSAGNSITMLDVYGWRIGVAVCYDVRFPELFRLMALKGADAVFLPGAFNHVSGPAHWELSLKARAVENTMYMAGISGIAPPGSNYQSWGHSMLVDPFGEIMVNLGTGEGVGMAELDPARIIEIRDRLPLLKQRRTDVYSLDIV